MFEAYVAKSLVAANVSSLIQQSLVAEYSDNLVDDEKESSAP